MCGIFGVVVGTECSISQQHLQDLVHHLFVLSETRGKEAAGVAFCGPDKLSTYKTPKRAAAMLRQDGYLSLAQEYSRDVVGNAAVAIVGHSRLVTNGAQQQHDNNQPVTREELVAVHNGIVVNVDELWSELGAENRQFEVDSEVIPFMVGRGLKQGSSLSESMSISLDRLSGMASFCCLSGQLDVMGLITNNGSLYQIANEDAGLFVFASEHYMLEQLCKRAKTDLLSVNNIKQLGINKAVEINLETGRACASADESSLRVRPREVVGSHSAELDDGLHHTKAQLDITSSRFDTAVWDKEFSQAQKKIKAIKRCTKCVLPATLPFIEFDSSGVCNYCRSYLSVSIEGVKPLEELIAPHRRTDGRPDCLVAFSGGRDSSYALHYLRTELGLNTLTYTYDWGMVTDLARRNQSRMCGALGVEHILVSADIPKKRANIKRNVAAWLKKPLLGTVPLFMAGDKQYFYHAQRLAKENQTELLFLSENPLEKTFFKSGFCGVRPKFDDESSYGLSLQAKLTMGAFYAKNFLANPRYLNRSIVDTVAAFASYYVMPHKMASLFRYIPWEEEEVERTLLDVYDWETAPDTDSTWRIGDGTAGFYNYIYYKIAGFSENDTFRSNQIREGQITREEAMLKIVEENEPRWESMQWYCETIGIDLNYALRCINDATTYY